VIIRKDSKHAKILLIKRKYPPFEGAWALPGGFVNMDESLEQAVEREIMEETNLKTLFFTQFRTYGNPDRDPRHRTVTVVYYAFAPANTFAEAADDAAELAWFAADQLPETAFDHSQILQDILHHLKLT
jgi:8-oxo-dGTP diphosphatase